MSNSLGRAPHAKGKRLVVHTVLLFQSLCQVMAASPTISSSNHAGQPSMVQPFHSSRRRRAFTQSPGWGINGGLNRATGEAMMATQTLSNSSDGL